jgi:hypothetical protein
MGFRGAAVKPPHERLRAPSRRIHRQPAAEHDDNLQLSTPIISCRARRATPAALRASSSCWSDSPAGVVVSVLQQHAYVLNADGLILRSCCSATRARPFSQLSSCESVDLTRQPSAPISRHRVLRGNDFDGLVPAGAEGRGIGGWIMPAYTVFQTVGFCPLVRLRSWSGCVLRGSHLVRALPVSLGRSQSVARGGCHPRAVSLGSDGFPGTAVRRFALPRRARPGGAPILSCVTCGEKSHVPTTPSTGPGILSSTGAW